MMDPFVLKAGQYEAAIEAASAPQDLRWRMPLSGSPELNAMIFALATDENTLFVFASAVEAVAYCEAIDVEEGGWIF
jgi:hypothetical protein